MWHWPGHVITLECVTWCHQDGELVTHWAKMSERWEQYYQKQAGVVTLEQSRHHHCQVFIVGGVAAKISPTKALELAKLGSPLQNIEHIFILFSTIQESIDWCWCRSLTSVSVVCLFVDNNETILFAHDGRAKQEKKAIRNCFHMATICILISPHLHLNNICLIHF